MTFRKYLVLAGVTIFAAVGDSFLSHGMKQVGEISSGDFKDLLLAIGMVTAISSGGNGMHSHGRISRGYRSSTLFSHT